MNHNSFGFICKVDTGSYLFTLVNFDPVDRTSLGFNREKKRPQKIGKARGFSISDETCFPLTHTTLVLVQKGPISMPVGKAHKEEN